MVSDPHRQNWDEDPPRYSESRSLLRFALCSAHGVRAVRGFGRVPMDDCLQNEVMYVVLVCRKCFPAIVVQNNWIFDVVLVPCGCRPQTVKLHALLSI